MTAYRNISRVAGNWLFCGRRWVDPSTADGRSKLIQSYADLCARFPALRSTCTEDRFLYILSTVCAKWTLRVRSDDLCQESAGTSHDGSPVDTAAGSSDQPAPQSRRAPLARPAALVSVSDGGSWPESQDRDEVGNTAGSRYEGGAGDRSGKSGRVTRSSDLMGAGTGLPAREGKRARERGGAKSSGRTGDRGGERFEGEGFRDGDGGAGTGWSAESAFGGPGAQYAGGAGAPSTWTCPSRSESSESPSDLSVRSQHGVGQGERRLALNAGEAVDLALAEGAAASSGRRRAREDLERFMEK